MELIKKLRAETGAGISDVKKALDEAGGDEIKAIEILRKAGSKMAAKKADRATNEGLVEAVIKEDGRSAVLYAVACETDFVSRNRDFQSFVKGLALKVFAGDEAGIQNDIKDAVAKLGENIQFKESKKIELAGGVIDSYIHSSGKVGVLVAVGAERVDEEVKNFAHEAALQIAALNPSYVSPEEVPAEELDKEKEIYREQLKNEGKPAEMIDKIMEGKVQKYYSEVCLLKQPYIKDDKLTMENLLAEVNKKTGQEIKIKEFVRISL
jgi:elongation factor Ts